MTRDEARRLAYHVAMSTLRHDPSDPDRLEEAAEMILDATAEAFIEGKACVWSDTM